MPHRYLLFALGSLSLAIGVIGIFVPLLPTTPLVILAAYFFSKSSPRVQEWLHAHPRFGPMLNEWNQDHVIRPRAKVMAVVMIMLSFSFPLFIIEIHDMARIIMAIFGVALITFIVTRKNQPA
jgi:uncharacterized protein